MRLQKFMAQCGLASRRASEQLIRAGKVYVNGAVATVGQTIDPEHDEVMCNGVRVGESLKTYILLNKPAGVVTTAKDTHDRKTVLDCLDGVDARVFPVGRLDMDVEGALILTNDGELAFRLTHPKFEVDKVYEAWVNGAMTDATAVQLRNGVKLEDGVTAPAQVDILAKDAHTTQIRLTLREGRKREIKRMCAHVGHPIRALKRIAMAGIAANGLEPGEWRALTKPEIQELRAQVGLDTP